MVWENMPFIPTPEFANFFVSSHRDYNIILQANDKQKAAFNRESSADSTHINHYTVSV